MQHRPRYTIICFVFQGGADAILNFQKVLFGPPCIAHIYLHTKFGANRTEGDRLLKLPSIIERLLK